MRPVEEVAVVLSLVAEGETNVEIARRTRIPRRTVADWRAAGAARLEPHRNHRVDTAQLPQEAYAYLLGLYLGDGCISRAGRTSRLRITLDASHPGIIDACRLAMEAVMPGRAVGVVSRPGENAVDVSCYGTGWTELFPQHGPGRKHLRPIRLADWQEAIVRRHPRAFIKGLYHSDGTFVVNRVRSPIGKEYAYPRYFFTNLSADIKELFTWACALIGVEARRAGRRNISVAKRSSVAILGEFLGPKV